ncbi:MAG: hypothetical protein HOC21_05065 [Phycisphaerae bacterium]|nr:hypothetical protein [Phycisphaerae bacterium]
MLHPDETVNLDTIIPIVVGAHLRAELGDRRRGYYLGEAIVAWMEQQKIPGPPWPLVCSDLWYLNDPELRTRPTICIGQPEVNAATAALSTKLETVLLEDNAYRIQGDPEFIDLKYCLWGIDDTHTNQCVDQFIKNALPNFLGAIFGVSVEK